DVIFGNGKLDEIMQAVDAAVSKKRQTLIFPQENVCSAKRKKFLSFPGSAYVKVAEGCDNHCSFCAIPSIRGKFRSRPIADVVAEVKDLIEQGIFEISLIAQDLASYGHDFPDYKGDDEDEPSKLLELLEAIDALEGRFRIRLLYLHPDNFPRDILTLIAQSSKFCQYFDIPFQSGSDKILKLMNRRGTVEEYIDLVDEIKFVLPFAVIRTTFMTGFPGETEEDFNATREFLQRIRPMWSGTFCFSGEEGTPAEKMTGKVPKSVAKERAKILEQDQYDLTRYMLEAFIGETLDVVVEELIEPPSGGDPSFAICRTYFQAEEVDGVISAAFPPYACNFKPGDVIPVKLISVDGVNVISSLVL
ncbi:MAG: MiaB/RimO family radical SAM methylthiotransferase, partial [Spirochaetaceae bacterium]|nr:MiaB/RimO family radical SAM methylthiotransferase [Spirochaetaceae bacterium]